MQLDNMGKIKSSLGLQGIDATIKKAAHMLDELVSEGHVSRFSDTVFTILVKDQSTEELIKLAENIGSHISEMLIEVDKRTTSTTVSIAIVKIESNSA